jgi:cyanate lyase
MLQLYMSEMRSRCDENTYDHIFSAIVACAENTKATTKKRPNGQRSVVLTMSPAEPIVMCGTA